MSVGVHAVAKVAEMKPGSNVVVFGAGPVGLLTAAAAKGLGAARVIAVGESSRVCAAFETSSAAANAF